MFGTIIMDSYKSDEIELMSQNIDLLCSPMDSYGWASAGIYSFWDYYTKEVLYIGLASDLCVRFRQHNGLLPISENACKFKQIQSYFSQHERLGYSILVQSPLSQPIVHRNKEQYRNFMNAPKGSPIPNYAGEEGLEHIRQAEGQLIESYKQIVGTVPPWNKIGGDVFSKNMLQRTIIYMSSALFPMEPLTIILCPEPQFESWLKIQHTNGLKCNFMAFA